jgi:glycosyltransferase involved in cell wall biosynthesis
MYNPYTVKKPMKVLNLISAIRLTAEKGYERMVMLADALDAAGIPFHWTIYTDKPRQAFNKSVAIMPPRLDILDFIADADYLVQLSDTEGYSYSIVEALSVGTPVICTAFAVAEEQGIVNGKNGFILPMDMSEIPVEAIYKGVRKFKCAPRESHYEIILSPGECEFAQRKDDDVEVRCCKTYHDIELKRLVKASERLIMKRERADHLEGMGLVEIME